MSEGGRLAELARYLELGNLGLNLPFALAFLFVASNGWPNVRVLLLVLVAFVGARTAGHSFNRWADREYDRRNPRTRSRAVAAGRYPPGFALGLTAAGAGVLLAAAYLLNPLALALAPVALLLLIGYSYTKRVSSWTTPFLGLVESITPAAAYVAVRAALPETAWWAVGGILLWGTAFETIHSIGDLESDRALGLRSLPLALGRDPSLRLVPVLHGAGLIFLGAYGALAGLGWPYYLGLLAIGAGAAEADLQLLRDPAGTRRAFRRHFLLALFFLVGAIGALWVAGRF
ncbi:MAG TPA: UbiA family prenyltransferase [Thermoplasmata archaeon]|nr:UbiA family prenyltransferase [Thermoplasmata archaeon]